MTKPAASWSPTCKTTVGIARSIARCAASYSAVSESKPPHEYTSAPEVCATRATCGTMPVASTQISIGTS